MGCGGTVVLGRAQVEEGGLRGAAMGSQKIKETLQTLKELLDDGLITEQEYEDEKREALKQWRKKQTEGEGGDRGQAPDAVVGTSSGRGREVPARGATPSWWRRPPPPLPPAEARVWPPIARARAPRLLRVDTTTTMLGGGGWRSGDCPKQSTRGG